MAMVVVFFTTYALILPAITLEKDTTCGMEEHTHIASCYVDSGSPLLCTDSIEVHKHTEECMNEDDEPICGYADFVLHTHDESCYTADGTLRCPLEERKSYTVKQLAESGGLLDDFVDFITGENTTSSALDYVPAEDDTAEEPEYEEVEITEPHTHDDSCFELEDGTISERPVCGLLEVQVHTHTAECFAGETLICEKEEHQHTEFCYRSYVCGLEEHQHNETCYDADGNLVCTKEEHVHSETCKEALKMDMMMQNNLLLAAAPRSIATLPVTAITGSGTEYHPTTGDYTTSLDIRFAFTKKEGEQTLDIKSNCDYVFQYPAGVIVPDGLVGVTKKLYDDNKKEAGTYTFVENADKTYSVHVNFTDTYVQNAGNQVSGFVNFSGTLKTETNNNGHITIKVGDTDLELDIKPEEIKYPDNETDKYDIRVTKDGEYQPAKNKLVYTVGIYSDKGTPDPIDFKDVIHVNGLQLGDPDVTVQRGTYNDYGGNDKRDYQLTTKITPANFQYNNGEISMSLPGLPEGEPGKNQWNQDCIIRDYYQVTYTYNLRDQRFAELLAQNKVAVESKDETSGQTVKSEATKDVTKKCTLEKSGSVNAEKHHWKITVNTEGANITGAVLTDKMLLTALNGSLKVEPNQGFTLEKNKIIFTDISEGNENKPNTNTYTIEYDTAVPPASWDDQTITNTATFDPTPEKPGDEIKKEDSIHIPGKSYTLEKVGQAKDGRHHWKITVNTDGVNIAGTVLTDEMLLTADNLKITSSDGSGSKYVVLAGDKITFTETLEGAEKKPNTNTYTIEYDTEVPPTSWNDQTVTNTAIFDPTPNKPGDEIKEEDSIHVPGVGRVDKNCNGATTQDGKLLINWTVTIDIPENGLPKNATIGDVIQWEQGTVHWMTRAQITAWAMNLDWENNSGSINPYVPPKELVTFWTSSGTNYTYDQVSMNQGKNGENLDNAKFTKFEIRFPDGLKPPGGQANQLTFTYTTTADPSLVNEVNATFQNTVKVAGKEDHDQYVYYKDNVVKTNGDNQTGTTDIRSEDGNLVWKVRVSLGEIEKHKVILEDKLPNNIALDSIVLSEGTIMDLTIEENGTISGSNDTYQVTGTYNANTGEVRLEMVNKDTGKPIEAKKQYVFTFNCHADAEKLGPFEPNKVYEFKNTVTVRTDQGEIGDSEQTQRWTYEKPVVETNVLKKSGQWENDSRRLNYSVVINPDGADLVEETDTLTLVDNLKWWCVGNIIEDGKLYNAKVSLVQSSVKLYYAVLADDGSLEKGAEVGDWKWNHKSEKNRYDNDYTDTITATGVPDETPLIFEYAYTVDTDIPKGKTANLNISNTAELNGTSYKTEGDNKTDKWQDQTSSAGVSTDKTYTFYKVNKDNYNNALPGAKFSVYQCEYQSESDTWAYSTNATTEYVTDAEGKFKIAWEDGFYQTNTLYKVVETEPPEGYNLPDQPVDYFFYFSSDTDTEHTLPDDKPASAVDLSKLDGAEFVENVSDYTEITVKKIWQDKNGNEVNHGTGSVNINLYRKTNNTSGGSGGNSGGSSGNGMATLSGVIKLGTNEAHGNKWISFDGKEEGYPIVELIGERPAKTVLSFSITEYYARLGDPVLTFNGEPLSFSKKETEARPDKDNPSWNHGSRVYTYSVVLQGGENILSGYMPSYEQTEWIWSGFEVTEPTTPLPDEGNVDPTPDEGNTEQEDQGEWVKSEEITPGTNWQHTFTDLLKTNKAGETYYYYVKEDSVTNYNTSYVNNDGITQGEIKVINKAEDKPVYELPSTGGPGTRAYTTAGLLMMITAISMLLHIKNSRRKEGM